MMRIALSLLLFAIALASARVQESVSIPHSGVPADSDLGTSLLSRARRVEQEDEQDAKNAIDITWVSGFSLKFQGCHHIMQWNEDADDIEDVRLATKRLVRFRLCPTELCSEAKAGGCKRGYGDYIVDMNTYVESYFEASRRQQEYTCEYYLNTNCDCDEDENEGDDFDKDECEYNCFAAAGMENECAGGEDEDEGFQAEDYLACAQWNPNGEDDGAEENRQLDENEEEEDLYYIGPYCSEQGGEIRLGMFSDDECTEVVDGQMGAKTFKQLAGMELPYSSVSIIGAECISCENNEADNGDNDGQEIQDFCAEIYQTSGKCEAGLEATGIVEDGNNNACNYIAAVTVIREDGVLHNVRSTGSPVATAFIVIFAVAFAAIAFYVHYLRVRLGLKSDTLL